MNVDYILSAHGYGGGSKSKDEIPPPPVVGFKGVVNGNDVILSWQNPVDTDFVGVKIVKNESNYPTNENDGTVIYDGDLQTYTDVGVARGKYIYYRAFTYDFDKNYNYDTGQTTRTLIKDNQVAPSKPTLQTKTYDSVTLAANANYEYSKDGNIWQTSNIFTGLEPSTAYTFYQRKKGTEFLNPSPSSIGLVVETEAPPYFLYTVIIDETNSNPESALTYADDAINMAPGSSEFDEKFGYYPVMFKNGVEGKKINPNNYTKYIDGTSADITSGNEGDVMVAFPRLGYKIERLGTNLHVSVTDEPNKVGFCYKAHQRGASNKDKFYISAYMGHELGGKLKSLSGKTPTTNQTIGTFRGQAQANGTGYELMSFYQLTLLQCMYIIKYKNLDSQTALGRGYVDDNSSSINTGGTNLKGLNFGETTGKQQNKLFGIEDFWGNTYYWIDGIRTDSSYRALTTTDNFGGADTTYTTYNTGISSNTYGYIKKSQGTDDLGFVISDTGGSGTTYYCDYGYLYSGRVAYFGGYWSNASYAGTFLLRLRYAASNANASIGAHLMYL